MIPTDRRAMTAPMRPWIQRAGEWARRDPRAAAEAVVVFAAAIGAVAHQALWWNWAIEDAAISYAYARNLAEGQGLVAMVGGERLEGYSNPTWVLLLAGVHLLGVDLFVGSRALEAVFGFASVLLTWALAREVVADRRSHVPWIAAVMLAMNTQHALWGQSGLENGLWSILLAGSSLRVLVEVRTGGPPWSALGFLALAWTRPEGILQMVPAAALLAIVVGQKRMPWTRPVAWAALFSVPWALLEAARIAYFAWPVPQTYYAKLEQKDKGLFQWNLAGAGWLYVRNWASTTSWGHLAPVAAIGILGGRDRTPAIVAAVAGTFGIAVALVGTHAFVLPYGLMVLVALALAWPAQADGRNRMGLGVALTALAVAGAAEWARQATWMVPPSFESPPLLADVPVALAWALLLLAPLATLDNRRDSDGRFLIAAQVCLGILWSVLAVGDWMKGFRWFSLIAVPLSILYALGVAALAEAAGTWLGGRRTAVLKGFVTAGLLLAPVPGAIWHGEEMARSPDTSPDAVYTRVQFVDAVRQRVHHQGPWVDFDVDMGAHMWWSDYVLVDMAGLIDIPLAQHRFARAFIEEYLFRERRPHFMHVHGNWAKQSAIPTYPEFTRDYVEIPGYPAGKSIHPGNHIRRDLLLAPAWPHGDARRVPVGAHLAFEGWRIVSPEVASGRLFHLEIGMGTLSRDPKDDFRVLAFLTDGSRTVASFDLPPAYDWIAPHSWGPRGRFVGHFDLAVPPDLPEGSYGLGFVLLDANGVPMPPNNQPGDPDDSDPHQHRLPEGVVTPSETQPALFSVAEFWWPKALEIVSIDAAANHARTDREKALEHAKAGACETAETSWYEARMHRPLNAEWVADHLPTVSAALSDCWARRATRSPGQALDALEKARAWNPNGATYLATARPLADALVAQGMEARDAGDAQTAYDRFSSSLRIWPWNAWARRWAEEARTLRLGLDEASRQRQKEAVQKQREEARKAKGTKGSARGSRSGGPSTPALSASGESKSPRAAPASSAPPAP